jgi:hypothetical protein
MEKPDLVKIIEYGLMAPSGDNCQPWKIKLGIDSFDLFLNPQSDLSLYNFNQSASYISLGAFIENIVIASNKFGFNAAITYFPTNDSNHIANIKFSSGQQEEGLFVQISKRATNRKPYRKTIIPPEMLTRIKEEHGEKLFLITDENKIKDVAFACSRNELLVLNNSNLHDFLFHHVLWSAKEADEKRNGMFILTMEMNGLQRLIFKICSNWKVSKFLSKLGLNKKIASENNLIYSQSSLFGAFIIDEFKPNDLLILGREVQRVWLKLTSLGFSLQPLTGIILLKARVDSKQFGLSAEEIIEVNKAYQKIKNTFQIDENKKIGFLFRAGISEPPTAISPKQKLENVLINELS